MLKINFYSHKFILNQFISNQTKLQIQLQKAVALKMNSLVATAKY